MKLGANIITSKDIYSPDLRKFNRREKDRVNIETIRRYKSLFRVGQLITSEVDYNVLFDVIIKETSTIMAVERCSIFLLDDSGKMLDAVASAGVGGMIIKVPKEKGVVGWVFKNQRPAIVNDARNDSRFYSGIDKKSELRTNTILCVPLVGKNNACIGALEVINSKRGLFDESDCESLTHLSNYITIALENAKYYKELKFMDHARERVINHLAHELSTPISLLKSVIKRLSKALIKYERDKAKVIQKIGNHNIQRLMDLQTKAIDIIKYGSIADKEFIEDLVIRASEVVSDVIQETKGEDNEYLKKTLERIESIYRIGKIQIETIDIANLIEHLVTGVNGIDHNRDIIIETSLTPGLTLDMDKNVLRRVLLGIIKNAIENTPDGGQIKISAYVDQDEIVIDCIDHGMGVSPESRDQIFGGFYHTQITQNYATKKPFKFNAGGSGIDLLRAKILSQRLGFRIDFHSKRCDHILLGNYQCTGKISTCPYIEQKDQCHYSGGSTFSIKFPKKSKYERNFSIAADRPIIS